MLKRLAFLACLAATPAAAAPSITCMLNTFQSNINIKWLFSVESKGVARELGVARNGSITMHSPAERPAWEITTARGVILTFMPDPEFMLFITDYPAWYQGFGGARVALAQSGRPLARGTCTYDPQGVKQ